MWQDNIRPIRGLEFLNWAPLEVGDTDPQGSGGGASADPQIEVSMPDGSVKKIAQSELVETYKNRDKIINEKTEATRKELEERADFVAEKKAQERVTAHWNRIKQENPELYAQLFPDDADGLPTGKKPETRKPEETRREIAFPDPDQVDWEDPIEAKRAFTGLLNAVKTIQGQATVMPEMLELVNRLKDFDPKQLEKMVGSNLVAALKELGPQFLTALNNQRATQEGRRAEIAAASKLSADLVREAMPMAAPERQEEITARIYKDALFLRDLNVKARMDALRSGQTAPDDVPLSRIVKDVAAKTIESYEAYAADTLALHSRGIGNAPKVPASSSAGEPEKKYDSPQEARDAYFRGDR